MTGFCIVSEWRLIILVWFHWFVNTDLLHDMSTWVPLHVCCISGWRLGAINIAIVEVINLGYLCQHLSCVPTRVLIKAWTKCLSELRSTFPFQNPWETFFSPAQSRTIRPASWLLISLVLGASYLFSLKAIDKVTSDAVDTF